MTAIDESGETKRLVSGVRGWERERREAGVNRRSKVTRAVADLMLEIGPSAITHRKVAARAEASLSATSYYFKDLTALMGAGAGIVFTDWRDASEDAMNEILAEVGPLANGAEALMRVVYPPGDEDAVRRQFELLTMMHRLTGCDAEFEKLQSQFETGVDAVLTRQKLALVPPAPAVVATVLGFGLMEASRRAQPMSLAPALQEWLSHFSE